MFDARAGSPTLARSLRFGVPAREEFGAVQYTLQVLVPKRRRATPLRPPHIRAASPPTDPCKLPVAARGHCEPQPLSSGGQERIAQLSSAFQKKA